MQIPPSLPSAAAPNTVTNAAPIRDSAPARERVRPLLNEQVAQYIPDAVLNTRIGKGTVASEFDRAIRVRLEGADLPASQRAILPETTAAVKLLESDAGPAFERLVRKTASVADAAKGADDLHAITFVPDEHAAKAVSLLGDVMNFAKKTQQPVRFSRSGTDDAERAAMQQYARGVAKEIPGYLNFAAAWNGAGDILVTPDVSRNLLATIGAYSHKEGDQLLKSRYEALIPGDSSNPIKVAEREHRLRDDWDTLVHETHHSISPMKQRGSETSSIFEEAVASIFGKRERGNIQRGAGANIKDVAADPTATVDRSGLNWPAWNRAHLPKPPANEMATAEGRYVDGPRVVRDLLKAAGIDLRTKVGFERTYDILQGRSAEHAPRRLADALIEQHKIDREHREEIVALVKKSVQHEAGSKLVTERLRELVSA